MADHKSAATQGYSAIDFLNDNHKKITGLFRQIETVDLRAPEMKEGVVNEILMELEVHTRIENEVLYPMLEKACGRKVSLESLNSLNDVMKRIPELRRMDLKDPEFNRIFDSLIQDFELHMREEQNELAVLTQAREELFSNFGTEMQARRDELMSLPEYRSAQPQLVQNPHGGEQKRKSA